MWQWLPITVFQCCWRLDPDVDISINTKKIKQGGFTLLELLISVLLMLGIVIVVQRYVAGVVVDQTVVQLRQDQSSQVQISLSNLKRDVAKAGSTLLQQQGLLCLLLGR